MPEIQQVVSIPIMVKTSRRHFLQTTARGSLGLAIGTPSLVHALLPQASADHPSAPSGDLHTLSLSLTATWAKTLLDLQVLDHTKSNDYDYGGIRCPTYHIIHGRVGDAIYPFLHMARRTNDHRYLDAAVLLYRWMERRVSQPDGSWLNEPIAGSWRGTTVFSTIALCEAIRHHGDLMDAAFKHELEDRLQKAGNFIYDNFTIDYGNINYPISATYALSLLGTLQDNSRFRDRGRELSRKALQFITKKDGFLYGEGTPYYEASKKGCFSIDLGYNVEESLPALTLYGHLNNDQEVLEPVSRALATHMEFLLPDGGWDNSWGTRNYKWTYWGSRTSDGCQPAYALLAGRDPRFYRVAWKNTQMMEQCTTNGLLYGGPHYTTHHVPPDIHHTFTHIKALTTILDLGITTPPATTAGSAPALLPRETAYGHRFFTDIQTWLIATGGFHATVTGYDREYKGLHNGHATGGALSMLWHEKTGTLLVASMNAYQLAEAGNMQPDDDPLSMPLTPRMELTVDGTVYMNICDLTAAVNIEDQKDKIIVRTQARLVDKDQHDPPQGPVNCIITYTLTAHTTMLSYHSDNIAYDKMIRIVIPMISPSGETIDTSGDRTIHIRKQHATVTVTADQPLIRLSTTSDRLFNFVPGLEAVPLGIASTHAFITIHVN